MKITLLIVTLFCSFYKSPAQITYSANTQQKPYTGKFSYGVNVGYWGQQWVGKTSDIVFGNPATNQPGIGATGIRYTLNNQFLEKWGYDIYLKAYKEDMQMGGIDNVLFLEKPAVLNHVKSSICQGKDTLMFKDIYLPIWDNNKNGTPVNDENPYALYVYKTAIRYKNYIKFWEVWNEPDFTTSDHGWQNASYPNSWFNKDPDPCDLTNILSPIYSYNRLLRISYEVIKFVDPSAYITTGGIGYPGFLDAILRNTDNPDKGKISPEYPLTAGAYFDVLSFHDYPQFEVKGKRHSDGATDGMIQHKNELQGVLKKYGYDGIQYPNKHFILTEVNVARKSFNQEFGGREAQINFLLKAPVLLQQNNVRQMYIYALGEVKTENAANNNFDMMGLYENLSAVQPFNQKMTTGGIAFKTISNILYNTTYDSLKTKALQLPSNIGGGAFLKPDGKYIYILWAKTTIDNSELTQAQFSFPRSFNLEQVEQRFWDYSISNDVIISSSLDLSLNGTPIFFSETDLLNNNINYISKTTLNIHPNPLEDNSILNYTVNHPGIYSLSIYDLQGKLISTLEPISYKPIGEYSKSLSKLHLSKGVYLVKLQGPEDLITKIIEVSE